MIRILFLLALLAPTLCYAAENRPNIILLVIDDVGMGDVGFTGGKDIPTPHMDQLVKEGCFFPHAYSNPMCAPARAAMLMGRYTQRIGIEDNRPMDGEIGGLPRSESLLPQQLQRAGYHTRLSGKWHLGKGAQHEFAPRNRGFDEFFGFFGAASPYFNPVLSRNGAEKEHTGYLTDILTEEACRFLRSPHEKPFFLHLAHLAVHLPQAAKPEDLARVPQLSGKRRTMGAIMSNLDDNIGLLMRTLKESGLEENTLVFLISDNGGEPDILGSSNAPHRGGKFDVWEGGIRVPFAMRWPGHIAAGTRFEHPVHAMDVMPTSLHLAQSSSDLSRFDGVNLMPYLLGEKTSPPHSAFCWLVGEHKEWRIPDRDTNRARKLAAIRSGDEKLVMFGDAPAQLFDLSTDPAEQHDLALKKPERVTALKAAFDQWHSEMKPQIIPADHPLYGTERLASKKTGKGKAAKRSTPPPSPPQPAPKPATTEQQTHPNAALDRFGGDKRTPLKATGFFRTEQVGGRWVFITPEGHPYIALGANHTGPTLRQQSRQTGLWARYGNNPDLAAHEMLKTMQGLGFTAGDVYQPESSYARSLPWITFFWYGDANQTFVDVFDAEALTKVRQLVLTHASSVADNPWVLGLGGPDLQIWDWKLVRKYRELPPQSSGRLRYTAFLRERYAGDIAKFNAVYGTSFAFFDDLNQPTILTLPADHEDDKLDPWILRWKLTVPPEKSANPAMQADNDAFCALVAETLFPVVRAACKEGAPNHLFLGEHLAVRMIPDAVIKVMGKYVDAYLAQAVEVSPQRPPEWQVFQRERWDHEYALLQKPIIIVDWGAVFSLGDAFEYKGATIKPERQASDDSAKFITDAFDTPYIIGLFLCKLWGDHRNDATFFNNRATRTYLKNDGTSYSYRTEALKKANEQAQRRVFDLLNRP